MPSYRRSSLVASLHLEGPRGRETRCWSRWLACQKLSSEVGLFGHSQQAAGVTAAWIHASDRRLGETWIPKYQRSLFFARRKGRQKPLGWPLRACGGWRLEYGFLASFFSPPSNTKNTLALTLSDMGGMMAPKCF